MKAVLVLPVINGNYNTDELLLYMLKFNISQQMLGGWHEAEVTQEDRDALKSLKGQFDCCDCCKDKNCDKVEVVKLWNQVVNGTMKWFWIKCCDTEQSVCIYVGHDGKAEFKKVEKGHLPASNPN